ncbi:hypothetical protein CBP51_11665 [Cellvibrio mixtus]|uniref:Uncharacterized protein n=1 Tax=Cellvibrio mixtus TaxID=39650 RepID=A0A266QE12_9GAMM|nr:hypothetical protein [Cellvibrio mixtus]OZY87591.1 hypothetical protein CBP51_11665 [Cellvibrio mixtus]
MYAFEMNIEDRPVLSIFCGNNKGSDFDYGEELDNKLKTHTGSYSAIIFIVPNYLESLILNYIYEDARLVSNISRYGKNTSIKFFSFNEFGALNKFYDIESNFEFKISNLELLDMIIYFGIKNLVHGRSQSIILTAPPGTTFKKPSGAEFTEFIKASELAISCDENLFVAFSLLTKRPKNIDLKRIYIDTSGISSFIVSLISYIREFSGKSTNELSYKSFNSYDGLKTCEPDFKDDIWVIISASSSNKLGKKILENWKGISHSQIVTLLSYKNAEINELGSEAEKGDGIVFNIKEYSYVKEKKTCKNLIPIQIIGENFTAQIDPPQLVVLKRNHLPDSAKQFLISCSKDEIFSFNKSDKKKTRNIFFNSSTYLSSVLSLDFYTWLERVVIWNIPFGIKYIAFDINDPASAILFSKLKEILPNTVESLDLSDISNIENKNCSVIVISPVISTGRVFLKANRDLRMIEHSGPRIFINICSLFKSQTSFSIFEKSLLQSPGDFKYKLFSFQTLFVGETESTHNWNNELFVTESFKSSLFEKRSSKLRNTSVGISQGIGFSFDNDDAPLQFNKHFAFWGIDYNPDDINHGSVYLSIAAALQNLRDRPTEADDSLYHHVYKHAVIDPENFSRFNEGVIQASLWRAAEDIEVNYKYLPDVSSSFDSILLNLARDAKNGSRNGLADILLGIAIGKIQLHENSIKIIVSEIRSLLLNIDSLQELIEYIDHVILKGEDPSTLGPSF